MSKHQKAARLARLNSPDPAVRKRALRAQQGGLALKQKHIDAGTPGYFVTLGQDGGRKAGRNRQQQSANGKKGYRAALLILGKERLAKKIKAWQEAHEETLLRLGRKELHERAIAGLSAQQQQLRTLLAEVQTRFADPSDG